MNSITGPVWQLVAYRGGGRRSYVIGFIIPYDPEYLIRDPNLLAQISGADAIANAHGYNLLLSTAGDSKQGLEAYHRFVRNHVGDGALVIETASSREGGEILNSQNYPYVSLGRDLGNAEAYVVCSDNKDGGRRATQHLLDRGHRRIGIIDGPPMGAIAGLTERLQGHEQALAEAGLEFDSSLVVCGDYTRRSGAVVTDQLLSLPDPPTAIFALNDRMAMGAVRAIHEAGLCVPEDIAVVGYDDIPTATDFNPPLTTVKGFAWEVGQAAAALLFKLFAEESVAERVMILPSELVIRGSS
ncbi:MAG: LacI family transcriptional regulator [Proteobacteria bacterium]|nr:LacI family transcriptional regulator [Pseudomonadota bacterium]